MKDVVIPKIQEMIDSKQNQKKRKRAAEMIGLLASVILSDNVLELIRGNNSKGAKKVDIYLHVGSQLALQKSNGSPPKGNKYPLIFTSIVSKLSKKTF